MQSERPQAKDIVMAHRRSLWPIAMATGSLALLLGACSPKLDAPEAPAATPGSAAPATAQDPARTAARMQECRARLEAGIPAGLVINAAADNGRPILWVGPAWKEASNKDKEALARDTACFFLSGDESRTLKFSVYDQGTDREVAVWDRTRLVEW